MPYHHLYIHIDMMPLPIHMYRHLTSSPLDNPCYHLYIPVHLEYKWMNTLAETTRITSKHQRGHVTWIFFRKLIAFLRIVVWHMRVSTHLLEVMWLECGGWQHCISCDWASLWIMWLGIIVYHVTGHHCASYDWGALCYVTGEPCVIMWLGALCYHELSCDWTTFYIMWLGIIVYHVTGHHCVSCNWAALCIMWLGSFMTGCVNPLTAYYELIIDFKMDWQWKSDSESGVIQSVVKCHLTTKILGSIASHVAVPQTFPSHDIHICTNTKGCGKGMSPFLHLLSPLLSFHCTFSILPISLTLPMRHTMASQHCHQHPHHSKTKLFQNYGPLGSQ